MNETDKPLAAENIPGKRPPVAWKITKVEGKMSEVTVIFPSGFPEESAGKPADTA